MDSLYGTVLPWPELANRGGEEEVGGRLFALLRVLVLFEARQGPILREAASNWLWAERGLVSCPTRSSTLRGVPKKCTKRSKS